MSRTLIHAAAVVGLISALGFDQGCSKPLRIPRIEPVLHGWDQPYRGRPGLKIHVFNTGSANVPVALVHAGGDWSRRIDVDIPAFVIEHPRAGLIVFDTGVRSAPEGERPVYPGPIVEMLVEITPSKQGDLRSQMEAVGLDPSKVTHVVLSDLNFDHTGGLRGFPGATVVADARERSREVEGWGLLDLILHEDLDAVEQWEYVDYEEDRPYATFFSHHDLLGDSSMILVSLAGHSKGTQGVIVATEGAPVFLTGNAAFTENSWRFASKPLWASEMDKWWEHAWRIKKFAELEPHLLVVPGHDLSVLDSEEAPTIALHTLGAEE